MSPPTTILTHGALREVSAGGRTGAQPKRRSRAVTGLQEAILEGCDGYHRCSRQSKGTATSQGGLPDLWGPELKY